MLNLFYMYSIMHTFMDPDFAKDAVYFQARGIGRIPKMPDRKTTSFTKQALSLVR